jgi:nucleotide-binding universal stress UspA family protein
VASDDEREVIESVGLFEAAVRATPTELDQPVARVIGVALDGSNQDGTARALAHGLARHLGAEVREQLRLTSAAEILRFRADCGADLVVIPVPFGRDIGQLKDESLGSVVDMLLVESPAPVLCVRQVMGEAEVAGRCGWRLAAASCPSWPSPIRTSSRRRGGSWAPRPLRKPGPKKRWNAHSPASSAA